MGEFHKLKAVDTVIHTVCSSHLSIDGLLNYF